MKIHHAIELGSVEEPVDESLQVELGFGFHVQCLEPVLKREGLELTQLGCAPGNTERIRET